MFEIRISESETSTKDQNLRFGTVSGRTVFPQARDMYHSPLDVSAALTLRST